MIPKSEDLKWFNIEAINNRSNGCGEESDWIFEKALESHLEFEYLQLQGDRIIYIHCSEADIEGLMEELGRTSYRYEEINKSMIPVLEKNQVMKQKELARLNAHMRETESDHGII